MPILIIWIYTIFGTKQQFPLMNVFIYTLYFYEPTLKNKLFFAFYNEMETSAFDLSNDTRNFEWYV